MKSLTIDINGQPTDITYDVIETDKGKRFNVTNIPSNLGMGDEYEFGVWESNNIYEIPAADQAADQNKTQIVAAIFDAEGIDYKS